MRFSIFFACLFCVAGSVRADDEIAPVRISGSGTVSKAVSLAVPVLREKGIPLKLMTETGSGAAIASVGDGSADIAISSKPLSGADRAPFPSKRFMEVPFGIQALALIVPRDVWMAGVHALNRDQIRRIYERDITNWKDVGGEDRPIKFYNPEQGHGTWEFFVTWLYGEQRKAPLGENFETVADSEEARNLVEFNAGSMSVASPSFADNKEVFALSVRDDKGEAIAPTPHDIRESRYPMERPLYLVTGDRATGKVRDVIEFMLGAEGQALVEKSDLVRVPQPR